MNSPRHMEWDLDLDPLKDLSTRIVSDRLDEVTVRASSAAALQAIERLGYPISPVGGEVSSSAYSCTILPHLSFSILPVRQHPYTVSRAEVASFGQTTGDLNPVHFDDDFARSHGFKKRISHGMIFNGWFSRMLGTDFPGEGTLYLRSTCLYLAPVYPDEPYIVRVSVPRHDEVRGTYRIVAQVTDALDAVATVAYADVVKRPR